MREYVLLVDHIPHVVTRSRRSWQQNLEDRLCEGMATSIACNKGWAEQSACKYVPSINLVDTSLSRFLPV